MKKAVALKYNHELPAPFIISKGKGELANRIVKIARENNVNIVENTMLADNLVEFNVGSFIPEEFYEIIAEILIYVMNIEAIP